VKPLFGICMQKFFNFIYALFFTRDDDLDILQVLFAAIVIVALIITWYVAIPSGNSEGVRIEALVTLRWLAGLLVITAVPKWLVPFISKHTKSVEGALKKGTQEAFDNYNMSSDIHEGTHQSNEIPDEPTEQTS
jgi:4-amino-4-deoxy-L-arabinose transferase-like glycosyltransferase